MRILHADLDAFFAAVEIVDNPSLKGKPVVVGGYSHRGVVATCNYEARKFGIHSAMPGFMAKQLCPRAIFLQPRMWRYKEVSKEVFKIFEQYTDLIEPLSIDEAFLDITNNPKSTKAIVQEIKWQVFQKTKLTISIGVSYNKFLAKLASDMNKPNGFMEIKEQDVNRILSPMSIDKVYGLGKKSVGKFNQIGIFTIEEMYHLTKETMVMLIGEQGNEIYDRIRGIDNRKVNVDREIHSIGIERTLEKDIYTKKDMEKWLYDNIEPLIKLLVKKNLKCRTITIKYKTIDFKSYTKSKTVTFSFNDYKNIKKIINMILQEITFDKPIRLLGITASNLINQNFEQLSFLEE